MIDQDAQDINQMMSANSEMVVKQPSKSKFIWVVLACVVVGVVSGILVYQQSTKPTTVIKSTPKPSSLATIPSPTPVVSPVESPTIPQISQVKDKTKTKDTGAVAFPKAGKLRVYYFSPVVLGVVIHNGTASSTVVLPMVPSGQTMGMVDTGFTLTGPTSLTFDTYANTETANLAVGWIPPASSKCGAASFGTQDIAPYLTYIAAAMGTEPIVSQQCWADYTPPLKANGKPNPPELDYNDYFLFWTYTPASAASATPTPSTSPAASPSPSPSPSAAASSTATSTPTPTPTPTPSPRVAMPDTSNGTPVTGVFEVTVGTVSVGLILLVAGVFGLLFL